MTTVKNLYFRMKQPCFSFLPTSSSYTTSAVNREMYSYFYGNFTGYIESGIEVGKKHIIKLNVDLSVDNSFNVGTGFDQILYSGSSIIEQPDGKIIATGTFTSYQGVSANRIIRLNTDGSRDNAFVIGTGFDDFTQIPTIDSLGRILVTGRFDNYKGLPNYKIARLLPNGDIDNSFVTDSGFNNTTLSVIVNQDDSMFVTGYFDTYKGVSTSGGIIKIDQYGNKDTSFNPGAGLSPAGWTGTTGYPNYLVKRPDQPSFYVYGYFTSYQGVAEGRIIRLNQDGSKDTSFNAGTGLNNRASKGSIIWGDKLILEGSFTEYNGITAIGLVILNSDGSILFTPKITGYRTPIIVGNSLFAKDASGCLTLLYKLIKNGK